MQICRLKYFTHILYCKEFSFYPFISSDKFVALTNLKGCQNLIMKSWGESCGGTDQKEPKLISEDLLHRLGVTMRWVSLHIVKSTEAVPSQKSRKSRKGISAGQAMEWS